MKFPIIVLSKGELIYIKEPGDVREGMIFKVIHTEATYSDLYFLEDLMDLVDYHGRDKVKLLTKELFS